MLLHISLIILAYVFGSILSAVFVCRLFGLLDPRLQGSKNPGVTNVLRLYGMKMAVLTLIGDISKGILPVIIGQLCNVSDLVLAAISLATFCGHLYPLFGNFKGGKGVATLIGILFANSWYLGVAFIITWLLIALIFRYSSLAALLATAMLPIYSMFLSDSSWLIISIICMGVLLFWKHRLNIKDLFYGREKKLAFRTKDEHS